MIESDRPLIRLSGAFADAGVSVRLGCLTARVTVREDDLPVSWWAQLGAPFKAG